MKEILPFAYQELIELQICQELSYYSVKLKIKISNKIIIINLEKPHSIKELSGLFDVEMFGINEVFGSGIEFGSIQLKYFDIDMENTIFFDAYQISEL